MKMFLLAPFVLAGKTLLRGYPDLSSGRAGTCSEVAGQGNLFFGGEAF